MTAQSKAITNIYSKIGRKYMKRPTLKFIKTSKSLYILEKKKTNQS